MKGTARPFAYTGEDNYLKGPTLYGRTNPGAVLSRIYMTNLANMVFPAQMRPELAKHVAEGICWAPSGSLAVGFTAAALLYASWQADAPSTLADFAKTLQAVFKNEPQSVLSAISGDEAYSLPAEKHDVGPLTTYHARQAIRIWIGKTPADIVKEMCDMVSSILKAALNDTSPRAQALTESLIEAVESMSSSDDEECEGIYVPGPHGVLGPFASIRVAKAYMNSYMRAHMQQKPLPPLPAFSGKVPVAVAEEEPKGPTIELYLKSAAINMIQRLPPPTPGDGNAQQRRLLESMANGKSWRKLTTVPAGNPLEGMYRRFPHFVEVLDFLTERLALSACGDEGEVMCFPPVLLRGVHGTGKSYFAKQIARAMGAFYVEKDLSVTSEAFVIAGMDSAWRGSKHGIVFDTLLHGETANPVICLEELDKTSDGGTKNSPSAALYSLLVDDSSRQFKDEFLPVPIDASRVNWICTANDGEIPKAVLDRLEIFEIKEPTQEQCRVIAVSIWESLCNTTFPRGHGFSLELGAPLLDTISKMRPRVMRKTLLDAAGKAALKGNKFLTIEDLSKSQLRYDPVPVRTMGF